MANRCRWTEGDRRCQEGIRVDCTHVERQLISLPLQCFMTRVFPIIVFHLAKVSYCGYLYQYTMVLKIIDSCQSSISLKQKLRYGIATMTVSQTIVDENVLLQQYVSDVCSLNFLSTLTVLSIFTSIAGMLRLFLICADPAAS